MVKIGRSVPPQGSAHARQMMEAEYEAMPGPSQVRERITNLRIGRGRGQPHRGQFGQTRSRWKRMPPRRHDCPVLTTIAQDKTMYASMFEPLNRYLEPSSRSQPREERGHGGHSKSRTHTRTSQMAASALG